MDGSSEQPTYTGPDRRKTKPFTATELVPPDELAKMTQEELVKFIQDRDAHVKAYQDNLQLIIEESRKAELTDPLTGLPNGKALEQVVQKAFLEATQNKINSAVVFADLDRFKDVNDNSDHAKGDETIKKGASILQAIFRRKGDVVMRRSGDEFVILLADCTQEEAALVAEHARSDFEQSHIGLSKTDGDRADVDITLSVGVASFYNANAQLQFDSPIGIINAADRAMYKAKNPTTDAEGNIIHPGRNRVVVYDPSLQTMPLHQPDVEIPSP